MSQRKDLSAAVTVAVMNFEKTLLVRDLKHANPQWKFPGGGKEPGETPEEAAVRELHEEAGVKISVDELVLLDKEMRKKPSRHRHFFFGVDIGEDSFLSRGLKKFGETGEETKVVPLDATPETIELEQQLRLLKKLRAV
ncbi:NUDIX hydrolase [Candidatus Kaiserbacteria bacterium]|nr:NUDIX hydrolase [Candidatus Kaiserbacteria bacterium]